MGRQRVWDAYIQLVRSLTSSDLVELPPDTPYRHSSSAVLLRGSIRTSGQHCSVVSKALDGERHFCLEHDTQLSVLGIGGQQCSMVSKAKEEPFLPSYHVHNLILGQQCSIFMGRVSLLAFWYLC